MSQRTAAPPKVLYVDDDPRALELLREQVGRQFAVTTASSGAAGLESHAPYLANNILDAFYTGSGY